MASNHHPVSVLVLLWQFDRFPAKQSAGAEGEALAELLGVMKPWPFKRENAAEGSTPMANDLKTRSMETWEKPSARFLGNQSYGRRPSQRSSIL
jgi:hypothetical protein